MFLICLDPALIFLFRNGGSFFWNNFFWHLVKLHSTFVNLHAHSVAGAALCQPPHAYFVVGTALCASPCADAVARATQNLLWRDSERTKCCIFNGTGGSEAGVCGTTGARQKFPERRNWPIGVSTFSPPCASLLSLTEPNAWASDFWHTHTHTHPPTQRHLCKVCAPAGLAAHSSALGFVHAKAKSLAHTGVLNMRQPNPTGTQPKKDARVPCQPHALPTFWPQCHLGKVCAVISGVWGVVMMSGLWVASSHLPACQMLRVLKLHCKVASSQLPPTPVVQDNRQFSSSSFRVGPFRLVKKVHAKSPVLTLQLAGCCACHEICTWRFPKHCACHEIYMEVHKELCLGPHMEVHKVLCLPQNLHRVVRKVLRMPWNAHGGSQSAVPARKSAHRGSCTCEEICTWTCTKRCACQEICTLEVHKVLHLPRNLHMGIPKMLCLPWRCTEAHKVCTCHKICRWRYEIFTSRNKWKLQSEWTDDSQHDHRMIRDCLVFTFSRINQKKINTITPSLNNKSRKRPVIPPIVYFFNFYLFNIFSTIYLEIILN